MKNDITSLAPAALVALTKRMHDGIVAAPDTYDVPTGQVTYLGQANAALATANTAVETAKAAYHQAIQDRQSAKDALATVAASTANLVYAGSADPGQVAALGLQPRSTSRARIVPVTPVKITALPQPNGDVRLAWDKLTNGTNVIFRIEALADGAWASLGETTAAKATLSGYAPGAAASFRIVATKNGLVAAPSAPATIYAESVAPALRLAA